MTHRQRNITRSHLRQELARDLRDDLFDESAFSSEESEGEDSILPSTRPTSLRMDDYFRDISFDINNKKAQKNSKKLAMASKQNIKTRKERKRVPIRCRPHDGFARPAHKELESDRKQLPTEQSSRKSSDVERNTNIQAYDLAFSCESGQLEAGIIESSLQRNKSCDIHHQTEQHSSLPWDQVKRTRQGMIEIESSNLTGEPNFYRVNIGPSPRGSMIAKCPSRRAAVAVIWSINIDSLHRAEEWYAVRTIPLVGCDWDHALLVQKRISCILSLQSNDLPEARALEGTQGVLRAYSQLSDNILKLQSSISELLKTTLNKGKSRYFSCEGTYSGFKKANIPLGHALDRYDLLDYLMEADLAATNYAQNSLWGGKAPPVLQRAFEIPYNADSAYGNSCCLVCFDELDGDCSGTFVECLDCGHRVCKECFCGYLSSSASDGVGSIKCPAVKCPTRLSTIDIAHILFLTYDTVASEDNENAVRIVFAKLLRFSLERYLPVAPTFFPEKRGQIKFCTNSICDRLLITGNAVEGQIGSNCMHICRCGTIICASCGTSHFGLACGEFSGLMKEIDSGRLCQEIQSGEWLKSNTRPCPRCSFPIQKNGGCNHMWCQQCRYYFCWVCGGEGQNCNAYNCKGGTTVWSEKNEDSSLDFDLSNKANFAFRLQSLRSKVQDIDEAALCNASGDLLMEGQLYQVLVWLYALALHESSKSSEAKFAPNLLQDVRDRIEIAVHVLKLRRIAKSLNTSPMLLIKGCGKEVEMSKKEECDIGIIPGVIEDKAKPRGCRKHSKRKKQSLDKQSKKQNIDTFRAMAANEELFSLCSENERCFSESVSKFLIEAVQAISKKVWQKQHKQKRKNKNTCEVEENGTAKKENLKLVKTPWRPWREGYVINNETGSDNGDTTVSPDTGVGYTKDQVWKGKLATKAKRQRMREKFYSC